MIGGVKGLPAIDLKGMPLAGYNFERLRSVRSPDQSVSFQA